MEGREEAAGRQHQRAPGQDGAFVVDPLQVPPRHVRHADGPRRAVQELVAVPSDVPRTGGGNKTQTHDPPLLDAMTNL